MIGNIYLLLSGYIPESIFYIFVIQMQLIEYFLWKNQNCINDKKQLETNKTITKLGVIINHLEPIALYIGILLFSIKTLPLWLHVLVLIYIVCAYNYMVINKHNSLLCTTVTDESKPHLFWKWNNGSYGGLFYALFLVCLNLLSIYGLENGIAYAIILNIGFIISYILYRDTHSVGAMWCLYASIAPWVYKHIIT